MNKYFQTVFTRESEFKINNITAKENLMENINVDIIEVKKADGKSRCQKSAESRWSAKFDNERMQ